LDLDAEKERKKRIKGDCFLDLKGAAFVLFFLVFVQGGDVL
jgi:hypothetical protein